MVTPLTHLLSHIYLYSPPPPSLPTSTYLYPPLPISTHLYPSLPLPLPLPLPLSLPLRPSPPKYKHAHDSRPSCFDRPPAPNDSYFRFADFEAFSLSAKSLNHPWELHLPRELVSHDISEEDW